MVPIETSAMALGAAYGLAVLGLAVFQRRLQYFPDRRHTPIVLSGVTGGEELRLETLDSEVLVAWHFPPERGRPVILYLHGARGALVNRAPRLRMFAESGFGVLAVSYRGYGGSTGRPTEAGMMQDAETAYRAACERYGADRLIIVGASLGTGIAVSLASKHEAAALVLLAPFLSAMDVAASRFPLLPVRWLMRDQFRSDLAISSVRMPLLMIHGERDRVIPVSSGRRLFQLANEPKTFLGVPGGGHVVLGPGAFAQLRDWIDRTVPARGASLRQACRDD
ncbi:MAG TPA: alpha/beta hydrolase [Methylocystis sp.]|nr:alpha/beta hydrolase [Methylocystis sp.]